jgi:hypothetical protein
MKPIKFPEANTTFAKDQKQYLPLPAYRDRTGLVVSCWHLSLVERLRVLFTGRIWLQQHTFTRPLQPQSVSAKSPFEHP